MTISVLLIALAAGILASVIGGMIGGMIVGGKHIGYGVASWMGGFYGPIAGIAGVFIGLVVVYFL